jgi:hypothetical protein
VVVARRVNSDVISLSLTTNLLVKLTATFSLCLLLALLIRAPVVSAQTLGNQTKHPTESTDNPEAPPYKTGRVTHSAPNYPPETAIFISIEPKYFTRADMQALAGELDRAYSAEKRFVVIFLDDYDALIHTSPIHNTRAYLAARRGYYRNDRTTGEEFIQFSTERGKPIDEVKLNLGKRAI